jgi:hypothetical protein
MASKRETAERYEGHGENSHAPSIKKGTYMQVGTVVDMQSKAISPNVKAGSSSGGEA